MAHAEDMARRLVRDVGLFTGSSSDGACVAALEVARTLEQGVVVFNTCDRGDCCLSSDLFRV
jgi:cysteine synthase B